MRSLVVVVCLESFEVIRKVVIIGFVFVDGAAFKSRYNDLHEQFGIGADAVFGEHRLDALCELLFLGFELQADAFGQSLQIGSNSTNLCFAVKDGLNA
jgi:hypothetical protein